MLHKGQGIILGEGVSFPLVSPWRNGLIEMQHYPLRGQGQLKNCLFSTLSVCENCSSRSATGSIGPPDGHDETHWQQADIGVWSIESAGISPTGREMSWEPDTERRICAILVSETGSWEAGADPAEISRFLGFCYRHAVLPLVAEALFQRSDCAAWPQEIEASCRKLAYVQTVHELAHCAEIQSALDALDGAGIRALLLKGTGLAYGVYASPELRPRSDTDLLVRSEREGTAGQVALGELGYRRIGGPAGGGVGYQVELRRDVPGRTSFYMDLHWRINNYQFLAGLLDFDELLARSVPVPALGPHAARLGNADALILALIHRAGNNRHQGPGAGDKLIWLYDMYLLVKTMSDDELDRFCTLIEAKRIVAIALDGLRRCADYFGSARMTSLICTLESSPVAASGAEWLRARGVRFEWLEVRALPATAARLAYLGRRLIPNADYMRERYPDAARRSLPVLYALRLVEGLGRLIPMRR